MDRARGLYLRPQGRSGGADREVRLTAARLSLGRLHKAAITASAALAALSVFSGSTLLAFAGAALTLTMVLGAKDLLEVGRSRERAIAVHGVTLVMLVYAVATFRSSRFDSVLLVVMLGIFNRFHLRGGQRDDFLIAGASAVLITAATTVTPGITFLFLLLAYLPALLWALWSAMILGAAEMSEADPERKRALVKNMAERPIGQGLGFIAFAGLGLMVVGYVFVSAFPRYQLTQLFNAGYFMQLPGASDSMELRTGGVPAIDDATEVLRVEPPSGVKPGALSGLYARLYVLDQFDGKQFRSTANNALYPLRVGGGQKPESEDQPELLPEDGPGAVRVTMNRITRDSIHPIATIGRTSPSQVIKRYLHQTASGTWTSGPLLASNLVYKVRLDRPERMTPLPRPLQADRDQKLIEIPESIDPRVVALAKDLTKGLNTPKEKISALLQFFSKGFRYSLDPLPGASSDPLVKFLFEAKQGHCELYAGALAVLLRVAGVKTRVATGFYSGQWNGVGSYLAFTQADAHAWVEAYDESEGWMWIDATPEDQRSVRRRSTLDFVREFYAAAEAFWFDNIIDFDERKRKMLIGKIGDRFEALKASILEDDAGGSPAEKRGPRAGSIAGLAAFMGIGFTAVMLVRRRRLRRPEVLGQKLRALLGERPDENLTLGQLLERLPVSAHTHAVRAIRLYEAMRFGDEGEAPKPEAVFVSLRALERSLAGSPRSD